MKQKTILILAGIAAALQAAAVLLAVFMTVNQKAVKQIWGTDGKMYEINSFPTGAMIELLLPMLIYGIFLLCIAAVKGKPSQRQILAIIFVILAVLFKLVTGLVLAPFNLILQARLGGALEFASYSTINNAISQVTPLFTVAAFALFCMAAGSCLPVTADPVASLQDFGGTVAGQNFKK
ncbi:MAG: hypothetical protein K2G20_06645 [Lachnospiraceae bacterium]|nr:hypothetical protein [Lachnospiraceae bacterium]